ncbi:MAG: hypothetical protein GEU95_11300 [Rhizobiales bacterium]|nr:hypothetical protein [Hyphomicrobiales bacterium]
MNINFGTFLTQCAAMSMWIFLVAGIYAIVEKYLDKHYPDFLRVDKDAADDVSPAIGATEPPKQV